MQVNSSRLLWAAMPLIMGMLSLDSAAEDLVYVPSKKPCLFLNTQKVGDAFSTGNGSYETRTYRAWADDVNDLGSQGGKFKCVNPHPDRTPQAVAVAITVRAKNGARGNLTLFANSVPPNSEIREHGSGGEHSLLAGEVEGVESHLNFDGRNTTNTTIIPLEASSGSLFKMRARLFGEVDKTRVHVTGSILGYYYAQKSHYLKNVITVSAKYGDFTNPVDAINSITDAAVDNPYLIKIGPGVYELGSKQLVMQAHVKIQGAGKNVTHLMGNSGSAKADSPQSALVVGANLASLEDLSVVNNGSGKSARAAMYNKNASPEVSRVRLLANGSATGICGIQNYGESAPILIDVKVEGINTLGAGGGVCNDDQAKPRMNNVEATGNGSFFGCGVCNRDSAAPEMVDVQAKGISINTTTLSTISVPMGSFGMFSIQNAAPAVLNSILEGSTAFSIAAGGSRTRIIDSLVSGSVEDNRPDNDQVECLRNFNTSLKEVTC